MENGNAAEVATGPLGLVLVHFWVYGRQKGSNEWHLPCWANDTPFVPDVFDWELVNFLLIDSGELEQTYIDRMRQAVGIR